MTLHDSGNCIKFCDEELQVKKKRPTTTTHSQSFFTHGGTWFRVRAGDGLRVLGDDDKR
jgi:hypothetical protein